MRDDKIIEGITNRTYLLKEGDTLDILSTIKSNYGYLAIEGGYVVTKYYGCYSTLVPSHLGANEGKKIANNQVIYFHQNGSEFISSLNIAPNISQDNSIRVLKGPQMNYFMLKIIKNFYSKSFTISHITNRMGVRVEGAKIHSIKSHNIASEGIVKGSIQVPGNGNPIVLITDHPTIGGYPKIATVILADIAKIAQFPPGTKFNFKEVSMEEAESLYKENNTLFENLLFKIEKN